MLIRLKQFCKKSLVLLLCGFITLNLTSCKQSVDPFSINTGTTGTGGTGGTGSVLQLSDLSVSVGTMSPPFTSANLAYNVYVPSFPSTTVTATTTDPDILLTANGSNITSGTASGAIAITSTIRTISVALSKVGVSSSTIYLLTYVIGTAPSSDASLSNLTISAGTLDQAFQSTTLNYTSTVGFSSASTTATATTTDANATMTINGVAVTSGSPSAAIALAAGSNTVTVVVTAEDGVTTQTYTIDVTRNIAVSTDASLSNLSISAGALDQAFQSTTLNYTSSVAFSSASTTATATTTDANATLTINGVAVTSGSPSAAIALAAGVNTITVVVTAEDGLTTQTYTIDVTRSAAATDASLSNLSISAGVLDQMFQSTLFTYTSSVAFSSASTTATATTTDANATLTINGVAVTSGSPSAAIALAVGVNTITVVVTAEDGVTTQTNTIDVTRQAAAAFAQEAYIKASDTTAADAFGTSVAISGDTLVVGAVNAEAVYVFTRSAGVWTEQQIITASDATAGDAFGTSVSVDVDTLAVGTTNAEAAYVFTRSAGVWTEQQIITASDATAGDVFGISVSVNADTLAVGTTNAEAAYVFTRSAGVWTEQQIITASDATAGDVFGISVSVNADTLAVGASAHTSNTGAAYVFTRSAGVWTEQQIITASDATAGDVFGISVSVDVDTLAVGASAHTSNTGAAYVFTRSAGVWTEQQIITASDAATGDAFGVSVSVDTDTLAVGTTNAEAAYVFTRSAGVWTELTIIIASNVTAGDAFGTSVSLDAGTLAVGASAEDSAAITINGDDTNNAALGAGAAYVFK